jgi:2-aminoadipate transaminase
LTSADPPLPTLLRRRRAGVIELGLGEPDPGLLPCEALQRAADRVLGAAGGEALSYGAPRGPGPLVSWLAAWLSSREGRTVRPGQLMITGGASAALTQVCLALSEPDGVALCESPTYHLAGQIFRDYGLEPRAVAVDHDGIVPADLEAQIDETRASGRPVALVYTVPSHNNPTGRTTPAERRVELVAVTRERGVPLIEDDPYREVFFDSPPPPLGPLAEELDVVRLGSFSKLLAPGLRLGWLLASSERVAHLLEAGWLGSGGGPNHLTAMIVHQLAVDGGLDGNLESIGPAYAERAEALVTELRRVLPRGSQLDSPTGGFFVWVRLPERFDTGEILPLAERLGVSFAPGARFGVPGAPLLKNALRLGFCGHPPDELREGARRLGRALEG